MLILAHSARPDQSPLVWHPHPDVWALVAALALAYYLALTRIGPRLVPAGQPVATRRHLAAFSVGVLTLWIFSDWPIHDLSEGYLYSVHMVQHLVYILVIPPLLILGTPVWCWRWLLRPVLPLFRRLVHPVVALTAFSTVTLLSHLPVFVTAAVESGPAHLGQHVALVGTAMLGWWPLTSRVPEAPQLASVNRKIVYLFFFSVVSSMTGSFLFWAREPAYRIYASFPRLFGVSALDDQRIAGAIMEVGEAIVVFGVVLVLLFKAWRRNEAQSVPMAKESDAPPESDGVLVGDITTSSIPAAPQSGLSRRRSGGDALSSS